MADYRFLNPITVLSDIGGIAIDITQRINENYDNLITQNPIEDGSPTTDHITNLPPKISLEGGFSDMRISNLLGPSVTGLAVKGLAKQQFDQLLNLYISRDVFKLVDGIHAFKDVQFKNLQLKKDRPGFSIFFSAELWVIIKVKIEPDRKDITGLIDSLDRLKVATQLELSVGAVTTNTSLQAIGVLA